MTHRFPIRPELMILLKEKKTKKPEEKRDEKGREKLNRKRVHSALILSSSSRESPVTCNITASSIPIIRRFFATVFTPCSIPFSIRRIRGKGCPFPLFLELDVILSHHPARAYLYPTWATGKEEKFGDSLLLGVVF